MSNLSALKRRRAEISHQIQELRAEDERLKIAEQVLAGLVDGAAPSAIAAPVSQASPSQRQRRAPKYHRELVLDALAHADAVWVRSSDIVEIAKARWGADVPERSLRPLLTLMKRDNLIVRQGRLIAHPDRVGSPASRRASNKSQSRRHAS